MRPLLPDRVYSSTGLNQRICGGNHNVCSTRGIINLICPTLVSACLPLHWQGQKAVQPLEPRTPGIVAAAFHRCQQPTNRQALTAAAEGSNHGTQLTSSGLWNM
jgi:hypothetical protein